MSDPSITARYHAAQEIARRAGGDALRYFAAYDTLEIDQKGHQDLVSEGDRNVELLVRRELEEAFPEDAIVGEEHAPKSGSSGFTWVIDPIDGTANFVRGIPAWTVVLACTKGPDTVIGVIHDPVHDELYHCARGGGAFRNDAPITVTPDASITQGSVGVGFSARTSTGGIMRLMQGILEEGGVFYRNASGALSLAYVACGKLLGFSEEHMNAWDCLAGQLLVAEAGGFVEDQDANAMIDEGGRVVAAAPGIWPDLLRISESAFAAD